MIFSKLQIFAKDYYSCQITKDIPVRVQVHSINGDEGFALIETLDKTEKSLLNYIDKLEESDSIIDIEITYKSSNMYWTRAIHSLTKPSIHETILKSKSMSNLPIIIEKGYQIHNILSPSPDIFNQTLSLLKQSFEKVKVLEITNKTTLREYPKISKKQIATIQIAIDSGYYDLPRKTTLKSLATKLNISKSSLHERIRRAENKIILNYFLNNRF